MNIDRTRRFYRDVLGLEIVMDEDGLVIFSAGTVFIAFKEAEPRSASDAVFSPFGVGLDHVALTCTDEKELHNLAKHLDESGIQNTGVKLDNTLNKMYVAFKDPDRIQWEFYMQ